MTQLICLANSRKYSDRCIAGIRIDTGEWIRPISDKTEWGSVPLDQTHINGTPVQPLDIIDIPLEDFGRGYEPENRLLRAGAWIRTERATMADILTYCESHLLHTPALTAIPYPALLAMPMQARRTLQLVQVAHLPTYRTERGTWRGQLAMEDSRLFLSITDSVLTQRLEAQHQQTGETSIRLPASLLVLSFGQPWKKPDVEGDHQCYRLIAAVLALEPSIGSLGSKHRR